MSKKVRKQKKSEQKRKSRNRRKSLVVIALILSLGLTSLMLAQWRTIRSTFSPLTPTPQTSQTPQLSKEYIYAGGKLVATEEPANASAPATPTNFTARADTTSTGTAPVTLSWSSATGATSYVIERSTNFADTNNNGFSPIHTVDCTSNCSNPVTYTDNVSVDPTTTYLYRVRSAAGSQQSLPSTLDFITTKNFAETISNTNPPGKTIINANHFIELAQAVNSVRAAAGLGNFAWSDPQGRVPASGAPILATHMKDLRDGLNQAFSALALAQPTYTDQGQGTTQPPARTAVKKDHVYELRNLTKGLGYPIP